MLTKDWITTPTIDFELKQYVLLAYLQKVQRRFDEWKLYPHLRELRAHLRSISEWEQRKGEFLGALPGELVGIDMQAMRLRYASKPPTDPDVLRVIEEVMELAEPQLQRSMTQGIDLRDELLRHLDIAPVGLVPLRREEGYILLKHDRDTRVYRFAMPQLHWQDPPWISMRTHYVTSYTHDLNTTPERIRMDMIRQDHRLPEPLTLVVGSDRSIPCVETFLPLARKLVYEYVKGE